MEPQEYDRMFALEDSHWWFQSRLRLTRRILDRHKPKVEGRPLRHLDIGCGTGLFLEKLGPGVDGYGLDFSRQALTFTRRRGMRHLVCGDSQQLPFADASFDVITAFDLIEHVDHDDWLVAEVHRVLRPGGILLATVPAHPHLWSAHDDALHHKRRYVWGTFAALFDPKKWTRKRYSHIFVSIFPPAFLVRRLKPYDASNKDHAQADTKQTHPLLNNLLQAWHAVETWFIERVDSRIGLSLMTVQEKID